MTVSSADTAELPMVRATTLLTPPLARRVTVTAPSTMAAPVTILGPATPCRAELTAERMAARRSRRLWGMAGISALVTTFGATVTVLDLFH